MTDLIIEVTRRCQLQCAHCLRGDSEPIDMKYDILEQFLSKLEGGSIHSITFSGGEPLLKPRVLEETLHLCRIYNITVENFYIATNGIVTSRMNKLTRRILIDLIEWYCFCTDNELTQVEISVDQYHYNSHTEVDINANYLKALSFVSEKKSLIEDKYVIKEGRGCDFNGREINYAPDLENLDSVYLNCLGRVVFD